MNKYQENKIKVQKEINILYRSYNHHRRMENMIEIKLELGFWEFIVYKALKALSDMVEEKKTVHSPTRFSHAPVTTRITDFYALCNIKPKKDGSFSAHQLNRIKNIKEALMKPDGNLCKSMTLQTEGSWGAITSLILEFTWDEEKDYLSFQMCDWINLYKDKILINN